MVRKGRKYTVDEVLSKIVKGKKKHDAEVDFDGDLIYMNSARYRNFKLHGIKCKVCGVVGQYFYKERSNPGRYHFNLYTINEFGHEVMMTKDHIIPKAQGGPDHIDNYQTMCSKCNVKKGGGILPKAGLVDYDDSIADEIINGGNPRKIRYIKFADNLFFKKLGSKQWAITDGNGKVYNQDGIWEEFLTKKNRDGAWWRRVKVHFSKGIPILETLKKE